MMNRRSFLTQSAYAGAALGLCSMNPACKSPLAGTRALLKRVSPESQGVSSAAIIDFLKAANGCDFEWHSFMIMRHDKVIAEGWWDPFKPDYVHTLYSLSKSFTSTAVGFAISEEVLSLDEKVHSFFPGMIPAESSANLLAMDIEHLLTMNTGHDKDSFSSILPRYSEPWIPAFLKHPVPFMPGSKFLYDTGATFMLSAIVQQKVGEPIDQYLRPRLFEPLGIKTYDWVKSPEGICAGGFGLRVNTEAIARFGQTYLNKGKWQGKQVVPESWVATATTKHTDSNAGNGEWSNGYGYQFWRCSLPGSYRGDGAYGQYCLVLPEQDMVIAVTSESWDMGKSMAIIFDHLVPGLAETPLKANPAKKMELDNMIGELTIPADLSKSGSSQTEQWNQKTFKFLKNQFLVDKIQFSLGEEMVEWKTILADDKEINIKAGIGHWVTSTEELTSPFPVIFRTDQSSKIAATARWLNDHQLQIKLKMVEGIHGDTITFDFKNIELQVKMLNSVAAQDEGERNRERRPILKGIII